MTKDSPKYGPKHPPCLRKADKACRGRGSKAHACKEPDRLYDTIPCGIVQFTGTEPRRIVYVNKTGCTILGYDDFADLLARKSPEAFSHVHERDLEAVEKATHDLNEGMPQYEFRHRIYRSDGSIGWISGTAALVEHDEETSIVQAAFLDVTSEEERRYERDRERYAAVLCSAFAEVFEIDVVHNTCRLLSSQRNANADGHAMPIDQALEQWAKLIVDPSDREKVVESVRRFQRDESAEPLKLAYRLALDTKTIWCQSTFLRMGGEGFLCCNSDVTDRMRHEDEEVSRGVSDIVMRLPIGVAVYDLRQDGLYPLYVSDPVCEMFGYTREEYDAHIANGLPTFAEEDLRAIVGGADVETLRANGITIDLETHRKDGTPFTVRIRGMVAQAKSGEVALYAALLDVTEELRNQSSLAWQSERYRLLSEMTHAVSFDYDSESDTAQLYLDKGDGMRPHLIEHYLEHLESHRLGIIHPDSIGPIRALFSRVQQGDDHASIEYRADYYGTGFSWFRANLFVVNDAGGAWHLIGLMEDIQVERNLQRRAELDLMVGISNHASTKRLVTDALDVQRVPNVAVLLDVDNFKQINDRYGHLKGDELLCSIGALLRDACRATDVVGRIGGDEFALFFRDMDVRHALGRLEALREHVVALAEPYELDGVSVSIGAYETDAADATYNDVFAKADAALYAAKREGKNRISVYGA